MPRADLRSVDIAPLYEEPTLRSALGFTSVPAAPLG